MEDISQLQAKLLCQVQQCSNLRDLDSLRVASLGKKGSLTQRLKSLGALPAEQRPQAGQIINQAKQAVHEAIVAKQECLQRQEIADRIEQERIDVTLPSLGIPPGSVHPISLTMRRIEDFFATFGFAAVDGPEIEDDWHNFTALNVLDKHPARAMHDTFYLQDKELLLRTHTSPVQIRAMEKRQPPFRCIAPGRVYRCDSDMTHSPMFHQVEGLWVDRDVRFSQLKGLLARFLESFFEKNLELRFRASYFPFTEPSAELDIRGDHGWIEVLGCGMVHPKVLRNMNVDPEQYSGFAFGMGVERLAMLYYGVDDLRSFFKNDLRFLEQFGQVAAADQAAFRDNSRFRGTFG
ncbi:MAG: phenylalanine--tRNA ligase subunit alpha [Candidatus Eutrophobiaceae bacterium]